MAFKLPKIKPVRQKTSGIIGTQGSASHGHGRILGTTKIAGQNYSPVLVCCFRRDNRTLIWEVKSKPDGTYEIRNIAKGLECFVVAFDPKEEYNAVIQDKVVAK